MAIRAGETVGDVWFSLASTRDPSNMHKWRTISGEEISVRVSRMIVVLNWMRR
jgi:hypothetical protein